VRRKGVPAKIKAQTPQASAAAWKSTHSARPQIMTCLLGSSFIHFSARVGQASSLRDSGAATQGVSPEMGAPGTQQATRHDQKPSIPNGSGPPPYLQRLFPAQNWGDARDMARNRGVKGRGTGKVLCLSCVHTGSVPLPLFLSPRQDLLEYE
jgi:hypothetical protein